MIKIELTQEQANALLQLIDVAVKAGGVANARANHSGGFGGIVAMLGTATVAMVASYIPELTEWTRFLTALAALVAAIAALYKAIKKK